MRKENIRVIKAYLKHGVSHSYRTKTIVVLTQILEEHCELL